MQRRALDVCDVLVAHADDITTFTPTPGGVVMVADATGVLAEAAFGHADPEQRVGMAADRLFEIGSISKVFTGLLVIQLVDEGRTTLETPAVEVLPWLDLGRHTPDITLRHLLNHSAGLVAGVDALTDDLDQAWALRHLTAVEPGRAFHYSNAGFVVLGLAASAVMGVPLSELLSSRLLGPMGMSASVPAVTHEDRPRLAVGSQPAQDDRWWVPGAPLAPAPWLEVAAADGNIAAPAGDLAQLVVLLLGQGSIYGREVISAHGLRRMLTTLSPGGEPVVVPPGCPHVTSSRYALGINIESIAGHRCVSHGGGMVGYSTFVLVDLTAGLGVAVLTNGNGDGLTAQRLARWMHARMTSETDPPFPVSDPTVRTRGPGDEAPVPTGTFVAEVPLGASLSVDLDPFDGRVTVGHDGQVGSLYRVEGHFFTDHPGLRRFPLEPVNDNGTLTWQHGATTFRPSPAAVPEPAVPDLWRALSGHYRSYSPWYPHVRIYVRAGRLWLAAPGGVEAPSEPEELVPLGEGVFRIGADPTRPERLQAGPVVEGRALHVIRDGCRYSRAFTG
jgi:CubicO group peptidase (beta-lactamase class C family)